MRKVSILCSGLVSLGLTLSASAETPLGRVFAGLRNPDPAVRQQANSTIVAVFDQELPHIEDDAPLLCGALSDPDAYVRQQASGLLSAIALTSPEHTGVVVSCKAELLISATDPATRVRDNSLRALLLYPGKPPTEAQPVFVKALHDPNARFVVLGASGLLKLSTSNDHSNVDLVREALLSTADVATRENLLRSVAFDGVPDSGLFQTATDLLYKAKPEDTDLLMKAVITTAPDKAKANAALMNYSGSASGSPETRKAAADLASQR